MNILIIFYLKYNAYYTPCTPLSSLSFANLRILKHYTSPIRNKRIKKRRAIKNLKDVPIHQVQECRSKNEQGNEQRGPSPVITLTWSDTRQASPKETERRVEGVLSGKVANEVRGWTRYAYEASSCSKDRDIFSPVGGSGKGEKKKQK